MNQLRVSSALLLLLTVHAGATDVRTAQTVPTQLRNVGVTQNLNGLLPLDARFLDEEGRAVTLGDYTGKRPLLLAFVYYRCPRLCSMILRGTLKAAAVLPFQAGRDFDMVAISIDPSETPQLASETKHSYVTRYAKRADPAGWHFLTGTKDQIARAADAAGFRFDYDPATGQYSHASTLLVITPTGRISRYLYGVEFAPRDVRLALVEASVNKIGTVADQFLLYCFNYDPGTGRYSASILFWIRTGAIVTIAFLATLIVHAFYRRRRHQQEEAALV